MNSRRISFLFNLICFFMNILHIYQICSEYFKFDVTTNIRTDYPDVYYVPTVTLCFPLAGVIAWSATTTQDRLNLFRNCTVNEDMLIHPTNSNTSNSAEVWSNMESSFWNCNYSYENLRETFPGKKIFRLTLNLTDLAVLTFLNDALNADIDNSSMVSDFFNITSFLRWYRKCFQLDIWSKFNKPLDSDFKVG